jgi:hypothetical protein
VDPRSRRKMLWWIALSILALAAGIAWVVVEYIAYRD